MFDVISRPRAWRRLAGYRRRRLNQELSRPELAVVEYQVPVPAASPVAGRTLLFFADLHWPTPIAGLTERCREIWLKARPDWVVFGGDLATYACHLPGAIDFLSELPSPGFAPAIAVFGNWDRRRRWFPHRQLRRQLADAGFKLLVNEPFMLGGIGFWGADEPRLGRATLPAMGDPALAGDHFRCLVSHCVETPVDGAMPKSPPFDLSLCGHSHGGQFRIPGFGALVTSSKYWKSFEYGLYRHRHAESRLIVTSGVGCSRIPFRFCCQPEIVLIRMIPAPPGK